MGSIPFIVHVDNDDLVRVVLEPQQLAEDLISEDVWCWETDSFFDMELLVVIFISQVKQDELSLSSNAQHVSGASNS